MEMASIRGMYTVFHINMQRRNLLDGQIVVVERAGNLVWCWIRLEVVARLA